MMADTSERFSDDKIIASVLEGHSQNFAILVRRHGKKIVNFINRMIQDYDEAQSLGQEAFLKVFENLRYYRQEDNFSAFLFRIAKNLTLNHIKKQKRVVFLSRLLGKDLAREDFTLAHRPHEALEDEQRESLLDAGLRRLPEEQRLALIMKAYLDFSYKQIAEATGWSIPKIETLISRAKNALKKSVALQDKAGKFV